MENKFATEKYRWIALIFLALGLAIVIIDNTVLNVAIPYILQDLKTTFDKVQWVVSGYALIIATLLITVGRLGDMFGRKKIFTIGLVFFAIGSFLASIAPNALMLFIGEAVIEAIGAAMMLTSSLSLLVSEFHGKERAIAFGIWGSVAGASATIGPLLGGYLTTNYSWRWSLRINVLVAIIAIIGSIFIKESRGARSKHFDWTGVFLSGLGLFSLIFGFIEGPTYGWWTPKTNFVAGPLTWTSKDISIIPFFFVISVLLLIWFAFHELKLERESKSPILKMSLFQHKAFSYGLISLGIVSLGQFGIFFILPIFLQTVLGITAFQTGLIFLPASISIMIFGPLSGFLASRIGPKWITNVGMIVLALGTYVLRNSIAVDSTVWTLTPGLVLIGVGVGMSSAQLTNVILSAVPVQFAGEASATNSTMRQVGTSIGVTIIGVILANSLLNNIPNNIRADKNIPDFAKAQILARVKNISPESRANGANQNFGPNKILAARIKDDIDRAFVASSQEALDFATLFILTGAFASLFLPNQAQANPWERNKKQDEDSETVTKLR